MNKNGKIMKTFLFGLLALAMGQAPAATDAELESGLIKALQIKKGTYERAGDSGTAIQAYIAEGAVTRKPTVRADYTDYRLLKKPATFLGHELLVIEEEYMTKHIGCCVSEGAGVSVRVIGSSKNLKAFAAENKCALNEGVDLRRELAGYGMTGKLPPGPYATLSCRERDAMRDD
jgi:hypothetical protein